MPFGIIATGRGGSGYNPLLEDDKHPIGRVDETRLSGTADRVQMRGPHGIFMTAPETVRAVLNFLESRRFRNPARAAAPRPPAAIHHTHHGAFVNANHSHLR